MVIASPAISSSSPISCSAFCCGCNLLEGGREEIGMYYTIFKRRIKWLSRSFLIDGPATGLRIDRVLGARSSTVGVAWYGIVRSRETVRFLWFIFMIPIHSEATTFLSYQVISTVFLCGVLRFPIWSEFIHCHYKRIYDSELCISLSHSRPEMVKGRKGNGNWPRILQLLTAYDQTTQHILAKFRSRKETIIFKACGQIVGCDES